MNKIIIYCEVNYSANTLDDVTYELISKACELASKANSLNNSDYIIEAVATASNIDLNCVNKAFQAGANRFILIKQSYLNSFSQRICASSFTDYFKQNPADVILFGATHQGRNVAPRITTMLDVGLVADCTELDFVLKNDELRLAPTRPTFGAELMATILCKKNPQCATIRPGVFTPSFNHNPNGEFIEYNVQEYCDNGIKLLRSTHEENKEIDFSNAKVVLCAGYGIYEKTGAYLEKLKKIAQATNSKIASTRKLVDFGLMPRENQIGQTGSTTNADVYVAFGVSGAIQHIQGMKNSKKIIAINSDENAEIFKYADYKVIANAKTIIDEICAALEV